MEYPIMLATNFPILRYSLSVIAKEALPHATIVCLEAGSFTQTETISTAGIQMLIVDIESSKELHLNDFHDVLQHLPSLKIMVMYQQVNMNLFRELYMLGVHGIIRKSASISDFIACMCKTEKGELYIENELLAEYLKMPSPQVIWQKGKGFVTKTEKKYRPVKLTGREKTVATLLMEGKSNTQICTLLKLQPSTVSTFKQNVFKKLNVTNLLELEKLKLIAV